MKIELPSTGKNWEELIRSDMRLYTVAPVLRSIKYSNAEIGGPKYRFIMVLFQKDVGYYYENFQDHFRIGKYLLEKFTESPRLFEDYLKKWGGVFKNYSKTILAIRKTDIPKPDNNRIGRWVKQVYDEFSYFQGMAYNADAIDISLNLILEEEVAKLLKKKFNGGPKKSQVTDFYNKLTYPDSPTFSWQKECDFLKILELASSDKLTDKDLKEYLEKYYWADFNWGINKEPSIKGLKSRISKSIKSNFKKPEDLIKEAKAKQQEKRRALKKLNPTKDFFQLLKIYNAYLNLHDLRKEGQMKGVYYLDQLMLELSKRFNISKELLNYAWPEEVIELAKTGKINKSKLQKRLQGFLVIYKQNVVKEYYGAQALKIRNKELKINVRDTIDLQGIAASPGKIVGKARVCLGSKEANKSLKTGEILVTGMTTPDFVSAMKRATAIITDEGGLTCHAAIISRELGVPCIVGTKFATRLIKTGDKIEVNANHGIIKLPSRK